MKISKALFLTLMVAALIGGLAAAGQAAPWFICQVEAAGPVTAGTGVRIFLTDTATPPAFQNQRCQVPQGRDKEFLAVALEAISLNKKVKVWLGGPGTSAMPGISAMYLQAQ